MKKLIPFSILPVALPAAAHPGHVGMHMEDLGHVLIGAALVAGAWGVRTGLRLLARPRPFPRRR
jgi:hypothetical protein